MKQVKFIAVNATKKISNQSSKLQTPEPRGKKHNKLKKIHGMK